MYSAPFGFVYMCAGQVVLAGAEQQGVDWLPDDHQSLLEGSAFKHQCCLWERRWKVCLLQGCVIKIRLATVATSHWIPFSCSVFCLIAHVSSFFPPLNPLRPSRWQVLGFQWVQHGEGLPKEPEGPGHRSAQRQDRCCTLLHNNGTHVLLQRQ